jgi:hypothetical protein
MEYSELLSKNAKEDVEGLASGARLAIDAYEKMKTDGDDVLDASTKIAYLSSSVGQYIFFPWIYDPVAVEFPTAGAAFEDPDGLLSLSPSQAKVFAGWKRPGDILNAKPNMDLTGAEDIYQCSLEDCSIVASLISIIHLMKRTSQPVRFTLTS